MRSGDLRGGRARIATSGNKLIENPPIRHLETLLEGYRRLPSQNLTNESVVAVAPADAERCIKVVMTLDLYSRNVLDDVDELVDCDESITTDVQRIGPVALS